MSNPKPPASAAADPGRRVLLLAPTRRDGEASRDVLAAAGIDCHLCQSFDDLLAQAAAGAGAVVLPENHVQSRGIEGLAALLADRPVWSDLPIILLSHGGAESSAALAVATGRLGNVTVIERPVRVATLVSVVRSALGARERQYQIRDHLEARRATEASLRQTAERLRLALEAGSLGGWEWDPATDLMVLSARAAEIFGVAPNQPFTRSSMREMLHEADRAPARLANDRAVEGHGDYDTEYRVRRPDGATIWVAAKGRGEYDADGRLVRMIGVLQDITARKEIERQLLEVLEDERAARADAEKANRLKDDFLSVVSHELRTPLNAILGWSQILRSGAASDEDREEGLEIIERNARAQAQIIEDLLDMSRIITGKVRLDVQRVDLPEVIDAAVASMQPAAEARGLHIRKIMDPIAGPISGDPGRLQQVVWNLLSNAIKFTPKGGLVSITLRRINSHIELDVTDTGIGIKAEFLPYVFERFRQAEASTTRRHGGLGLGLSIVKNIVELHGGTIEAVSAGDGKGSTFRVILPMIALRQEDDGAAVAHRIPPPGGRPGLPDKPPTLRGVRVLIVDDDADARALVKRLLEDCQADATTACSAEQAMASLGSRPFDVIVSDVGMPGRDGYDFDRELRALPADRGGRTPALALTALARSEDRTRALLAGFDMHVAKPVEPAELCAVVARLAGRA